jgi:hypothetical protein
MVITLCGSARFEQWFRLWNEVLTLSGHAVFDIAVPPSHKDNEKDWYSPREKAALDKAHKLKIDASDAILVLNVFAYIGDSTMSEINHARQKDKKCYFLESWGKGLGIYHIHTAMQRHLCDSFGVPEYASPIDTYPLSGKRFSAIDLLPIDSDMRRVVVHRLNVFEKELHSWKIKPICDIKKGAQQ